MLTTPSFTIGIEEEYMLVNPESGDWCARCRPR